MGLKITANGAARDIPEHEAQATAASRKGPRRIAKGTAQQEAFWAELAGGTGHMLAEARAGCAKSSSCREGMWRMPRSGLAVRYAVYNKANADEFRADCPPGVDVGTCHAFGYEALRRAFNSRTEKLKSYILMDEIRETKGLARFFRKSIAMLVAQAKGQYATAEPDECELLALLDHYDINAYGRPGLIASCAAEVMKKSAACVEVVDFDDMLWLPVLHRPSFPACDVLFLDEVQDWNPIQHDMIPLLCPSGRVVGVGDRFQAVYQWRGAAADGIPNLEASLAGEVRGLARMPLTITFRCPRLHVLEANQYVPDLQAHESNGDGVVERGVPLDDCLERLQPNDRVICPRNAPVVSLALRLVAQRRRAFVRGRGIGDQLLDIVHKAGECRTIAALCFAVDGWRNRELLRLAEREGVDDIIESAVDRAAGLQAVASACSSPSEVPAAISALFSEADCEGAVNLSTVHRAKGLESERVWFLDSAVREPKAAWEAQQMRNLRYVAVTRSKQFLAYVTEESKPKGV